ncbi:HTH domain-containing protein [Acidithiobacillus sp. HP-11]|uniref:HVO_A0114 family putative DNA-binding protein n=1 Tax=Acidithiobacillus sp. HP-11 TaxID=2697656 RepID=UPI00187AE646|nr:HTH domain-containing protein [Acidithiobacillus sp. HP-11]MBE7567560.1 HTH domain-containing protein [Acidithiobacillus sp. HP-11]
MLLQVANEKMFFERGRKVARTADAKQPISEEKIISFEDPADLLHLLTTTRLALMQVVLERPLSITEISERLGRDRSAVKRDIDLLADSGLVIVEEKPLPGHGRKKEVRPAAYSLRLEAVLA